MSVDNFDIVASLMHPEEDPELFYLLQVIRRRKDNPEMVSAEAHVVLTRYIRSRQELLAMRGELIAIADAVNARVTIRLGRRSYKAAVYDATHRTLQYMEHGKWRAAFSSVLRAAGAQRSVDKLWMLDVDGTPATDTYTVDYLTSCVARQLPDPDTDKVLAVIPSLTGFHMVTGKFARGPAFDSLVGLISHYRSGVTVGVHKSCNTNVYIPTQHEVTPA